MCTWLHIIIIMLMAKCMCTWLHHLLKFNISKRNVLSCTNSGQPGWFHVETYMYMCVFGLWFAITKISCNYHISFCWYFKTGVHYFTEWTEPISHTIFQNGSNKLDVTWGIQLFPVLTEASLLMMFGYATVIIIMQKLPRYTYNSG